MKTISEFNHLTLSKILAAKTALTTEGKTAEEVSASIGETFKYEGDKLKYALAAADLSKGKTDLRRILVIGLSEGESAPAKSQEVDGAHYIVESQILSKPVAVEKTQGKGGRGGPRKGGPGGGGPKSSPWGASPEEIAAKKAGSKAAKEAAKA